MLTTLREPPVSWQVHTTLQMRANSGMSGKQRFSAPSGLNSSTYRRVQTITRACQ